ncbi:photosystem I PsaA/PsaB [Artemisia annua]|uniref:Photosystem I PsaA/PsaB n=1 Tax=Artemisia annua TaxID=35608 RepID=A0A2U1PFM8_ARTAN|nr:photosystem I PsaA/PsaB [Artemisia annua]
MKDLLDAHIPPGGRLGRGHKDLYDTIKNSIHFQLGLALASLGVITSLVAQHISFPEAIHVHTPGFGISTSARRIYT